MKLSEWSQLCSNVGAHETGRLRGARDNSFICDRNMPFNQPEGGTIANVNKNSWKAWRSCCLSIVSRRAAESYLKLRGNVRFIRNNDMDNIVDNSLSQMADMKRRTWYSQKDVLKRTILRADNSSDPKDSRGWHPFCGAKDSSFETSSSIEDDKAFAKLEIK